MVQVHLGLLNRVWGYSSVGRAPALQAGGQEFESLYLHWFKKLNQREFFENYTVKENGSFSEIKQKKESSLLYIEIYAKEQFEKLQEVMRTYHSQI